MNPAVARTFRRFGMRLMPQHCKQTRRLNSFRVYRGQEHGESLRAEQARATLEAFAGAESLDALDEDEQPRVILVARDFRAGVTNTVLWLSRNFALDITCVQLIPYSVEGSLILTSNVLIPLPEAADYEVRLQEKRRKASEVRERSWTWRQRKPSLQVCRRGAGDVRRRRYGRWVARGRASDRHMAPARRRHPQRLARAKSAW
jgi:hypothetical protein